MPHVFISYVHENWDSVRQLCDALKACGIDIWLDREQISPGTRWAEAIRDAISQGAFFIACFSEEYNRKDRSYMNEEIIVAIEELRLRPFNRAWFIPVLLTKGEIPNRNIGAGETLRSIQWVDVSENWNDGIKRILNVIDPTSARVYELTQALNEGSTEIRIKAANDLGGIGMAAENATPALLNALKDENEDLKATVIEALIKIGVSTDEIVSGVVSSIDRKSDSYEPIEYSAPLVGIGSVVVPALINEWGKPHRDHHKVWDLLNRTLERIGEPALPALIEALRDASSERKELILSVFTLLGKKAQPAVSSILPIVVNENENGSIRSWGIQALGWIGDPSAVPCLTALLEYDVSNFEHLSQEGTPAEALANIGDPSAIAAISRSLKDERKSALHRGICAVALARFRDPTVLPVLIETLQNENNDPDLRCRTTRALEYMSEFMGEVAKDAVTALISVTEADDLEVRFCAARAVWRIDRNAELVVPVFAQGLKREEPSGRSEAASLLGEVGRDAVDAVPELRKALKDRVDYVRESVAEALSLIELPN